MGVGDEGQQRAGRWLSGRVLMSVGVGLRHEPSGWRGGRLGRLWLSRPHEAAQKGVPACFSEKF